MSADNELHNEGKKREEKYMWLGYGNYSGAGLQGPINPGNVRAGSGMFDQLFELFSLKDKAKSANREDSENVRDPSW
jgi:hypothetical protein